MTPWCSGGCGRQLIRWRTDAGGALYRSQRDALRCLSGRWSTRMGSRLVTGELFTRQRGIPRGTGDRRRVPGYSVPGWLEGQFAGRRPESQLPGRVGKGADDQGSAGLFPGLRRGTIPARPLDQPETAALAAYTCCVRPELVLAYHTQGSVIYHTYGGLQLPEADVLAEEFAAASGYAVEDVPAESANAGFKDWFLQRFRRPGFTIEAGLEKIRFRSRSWRRWCGETRRCWRPRLPNRKECCKDACSTLFCA